MGLAAPELPTSHFRDGSGNGQHGESRRATRASQPSVSKAIANIEHTIGVRLLDRTPQGVETTAHGRALLRRGSQAFGELKQGIKDIEFLADPTAGEVRVMSRGFRIGIAYESLGKLLSSVSRRHSTCVCSQ